ncbi:hypothetical protein N0V90_006657 [Kalmusia sp. IMI 367209]|nr:hypothetical protein N0V90_006657 [Kalmusia sp. IMI 367209]
MAVHLLPKSHPDPSTWTSLFAKQKALRLHSLLTSPESFSSTYERESAFADADWEARLRNASASTFVATNRTAKHAAAPGVLDAEALLEGEWVGSAVLVGPASTNDEDERSTATFEIYGLFVLPDARGTGLGSALLEAAADYGRVLAAKQGCERVVVRISVAPGNERALKLYERVGFVEKEAGAEEDMELGVRVLSKELVV